MGLIGRLLLYLLLATAAARAAMYLAYAALMLPTPVEAHNLEAKMVLLAYRAERGLSLYPDWRDYPHVANFFGPVSPLATGLLGRACGADFRGLFLIGRGLSFASTLLTTALVAAWIARRYGRGAGLVGAFVSLGAGPMYGFTTMVRADAPAEALGVGGFFLVIGAARSPAGLAAGVALLVLSALTKQTVGVFLLAAALALAASGRKRRALACLAAGLAAIALVVLAVNALAEPYFAASLLGEAQMPWSLDAWVENLWHVAASTPELLLFPLLGLVSWLRGGRRGDPAPAVLSLVLLAASVGLSGKVGSDINYFLSLRVPSALAVGALWRAARDGWRPPAAAALVVAATLTLVPSLVVAVQMVMLAWIRHEYFRTPDGRTILATFQSAIDRARDPRVRLLTDSGLVDTYQGERAAFGDPFLFKTLVEAGRITPTTMERRIEEQEYDLIVTTHNLDSPRYLRENFRLPLPLVERVRLYYVLTGAEPSSFVFRENQEPPAFFIYTRRGLARATAAGAGPAAAPASP